MATFMAATGKCDCNSSSWTTSWHLKNEGFWAAKKYIKMLWIFVQGNILAISEYSYSGRELDKDSRAFTDGDEGCESNDKPGVADKVTRKKFLLCLPIDWTVIHDNVNDNNSEKLKNLFLWLASLFLTWFPLKLGSLLLKGKSIQNKKNN